MDDIRNVRLARIVLSCEQGERCTVCAFFPDRTNIIWSELGTVYILIASLTSFP